MIAIPFCYCICSNKIDFQLLWRYFPGQIKVSRQLLYGLEPFIYTKENLYIIALVRFFHNICSRSFLFYDPTIGFGLDIVTSDILGDCYFNNDFVLCCEE
jgi:hypothetical protein